MKVESFKKTCDHTHSDLCQQCESLRQTLDAVRTKISDSLTTFYNKEHQEDLLYDFDKAKADILDWKANIRDQ